MFHGRKTPFLLKSIVGDNFLYAVSIFAELIFSDWSDTVKSAKETQKEAEPIDNELYIQHISQMLRGFREEPLRAVYMVVQQLHRLQGL